jgi:hypothetical protein
VGISAPDKTMRHAQAHARNAVLADGQLLPPYRFREKEEQITFRSIPSDGADSARMQRGIDITLNNVRRGLITRCGNAGQGMDALLLAGDVSLCFVATNDKSCGCMLRSVSHIYANNVIVGVPLSGEPDVDYRVGDVVFFGALRKPDGGLRGTIAKVDSNCDPVVERLAVIAANLIRQGIDLRHAPLDLAVVTDAGWARRQLNYGQSGTAEAADTDKIARGIRTTLGNLSKGIVPSIYTSPEELHDGMIYDAVIVLAAVVANDSRGVEIRLLTHRYCDEQVCTRLFADRRDPELKVGDLVLHTMSLFDGLVRETIITIKPPRERTSVDPAKYVAVANVWSSYAALLTRIEAFFTALIKQGIDVKKVGFEPSLLGSSALEGGIVGRIDFNQGADA